MGVLMLLDNPCNTHREVDPFTLGSDQVFFGPWIYTIIILFQGHTGSGHVSQPVATPLTVCVMALSYLLAWQPHPRAMQLMWAIDL